MKEINIDVNQLENAAKIRLDDSQKQKLISLIDSVTDRFDKLSNIIEDSFDDVNNVTAMQLRDDVAINHFNKKELLENAPKKNDDYVIIPKVIE